MLTRGTRTKFIMQTGAELNVFFWKQQPLWTTVLQILQFVSLVVGLVFTFTSLGLFASLNNEFREDAIRPYEDKYCILFITEVDVEVFSEKQNCLAVVWGQASVAILILVLMILLISHMLFLRKWYTVLVFLTFAVLTLLLAFAMSIVMSAGIKQSCDTYKDEGGHDSCSDVKFPRKGILPLTYIEYYDDLVGSMVCVWFETFILLTVVIESATQLVLTAITAFRTRVYHKMYVEVMSFRGGPVYGQNAPVHVSSPYNGQEWKRSSKMKHAES